MTKSIRHRIACATLSLAAAVALASRGVVAQQPQSVEAHEVLRALGHPAVTRPDAAVGRGTPGHAGPSSAEDRQSPSS